MNHLLEVRNLSVYDTTRGTRIVDNVSLSLDRGKILVLLGESGSGKTTLCRALTRLGFPSASLSLCGSVTFQGTELLHCEETGLQRIRRSGIRYIFQDPQQALNPIATIRKQLKLASYENTNDDILIRHLLSVGLKNAEAVLRSYPHQLSIGMAQRVMIAMALLPTPALIIADEPTSALDATLRHEMIQLLQAFQQHHNAGLILVSHDIEIARRVADDVALMSEGRIITHTASVPFFQAPYHPEAAALLRAAAKMRQDAVRTI